MGVVSIVEQHARGGTLGSFPDISGRRSWRVKCDSDNDDIFTIAASGLLPANGDAHPNNADATLRSLSGEAEKDKKNYFVVTANYSAQARTVEEEEREAQPNPLGRSAKLKWRTVKYTRAITKDKNGEAILNSAGDPFDPPVEIQASHWMVDVTRNISAAPSWIIDYEDAINATSFYLGGLLIPARVAKLSEIEIGEQATESGVRHYPFRMSIELRRETWRLKILDQGLHYYDDDAGEFKRAVDANMEPTAGPVLLDGMGGQLDNPSLDNAVFLDFDVFPENEFSILPIT